MNMRDRIDDVHSREELSRFVAELNHDLGENVDEWENRDLPSFLEAMSAWIADMDGYYQNIGETCPAEPSWKVVAEILAAATMYE